MSIHIHELFTNAPERRARVTAAVEEALAQGVFYDDDMRAFVNARCRAHDEAQDVFLGVFDRPTDWTAQRAQSVELSTLLKASPRGTWLIIRSHNVNTGKPYLAPSMSDGSGTPSTGGAGDHYYDEPPTFELVYQRMAGFETYIVRKHVEALRALAADRAVIANYHLAVGQSFKNVNLGYENGKHNRITLTAVDTDAGVLHYALVKRGSAKRYAGTMSARTFPERAGLGKDPSARAPLLDVRKVS